jgi:prepilin-type N-terminal cleavage/methylation domain-containing protein
MKKRLTAFTIPELMVVMLLSGIVISAMYVLLQFSFFNYFRYFTATEKLNRIARMNYLLTKDIHTSAVLQKTLNGFTFTSPSKMVSYNIIDSMMVRTDKITDTLYASAIKCELFLNDSPSIEGELADLVQLTIVYKGEELFTQYHKNMDAKSFLLIEETYGNRNK